MFLLDTARAYLYTDGQNSFVLGCVKSPPRQEAESRNLGQTVLAIYVCINLCGLICLI